MHYALKVSFLHLMCFCVFYLKNVIRLILAGHVMPKLNIGSYTSGSRFRTDHVGKFWQTLGYVVFTKFSPFLSRYCVDITDLRSKIGFSDLLHLILIKFCPDQSVNVLQQTFLYVRLQLSMIHIMYVIVIWNLIEFK